MIKNKFYCILIHYDEIAIKLGNRRWFEKKLIQNIKNKIISIKYRNIHNFCGRIFINNINKNDYQKLFDALKNVMGISSIHMMVNTDTSIESIKEESIKSIKAYPLAFKTFKVFTKRQNKSFSKTSQELNTIIGEVIRVEFKKDVRLKNPDIELRIEIIDNIALIGVEKIQGYGGLPVGTGEKALSLISSGIDSPVASFKMLKRGVQLSYIHFHSSPATGDESIHNVKKIICELSKFQSSTQLFLVPFLDIQKAIMKISPNKYWIILFRRAMIKVASDIANKNRFKALVTGDNVGQVASQTLSNINVISEKAKLPILRPLIGYNKKDIINLATNIGTYDISILPYEDCCGFFVPRHPETKANLKIIQDVEKEIRLDFNKLNIDLINTLNK